MLFGSWLRETGALQREAYGYDPGDGSDLETWLNYVREQTLAGFVELGEFLQCLTWKPWAREKRIPTELERGDAIGELVDVLHFVANDLVALGVTDAELSRRYEFKMNVNRSRMARGGHG